MATYYIDPAGNDTSGNGSIGNPWRTLTRACSLVTTWGDVIHANSGTYTITSQGILAVGVSLEGDGYETVFNCSVNASGSWGFDGFAVRALSNSNTDGDQSISYINFNGGGNYVGWGAIGIQARNNVEVHHCDFTNFSHWGVRFYGGGEPPAVYMTGSSFHHNNMNDCAGYYDGSLGCLGIGGLDGMDIYANTIVQPANRGVTNEGEPIFGVEGFLKNIKIWGNTLTKVLIAAGRWDFAIECWNWEGGNEIWNNTITGSIDLVGASKGSAAYSVWIHDNIIGQPRLQAKQSVRGVLLEYRASDIKIERNFFHHLAQPIFVNPNYSGYYGGYAIFNNNIIRYNVADQVGAASGQPTSGWGVYFSEEVGGGTVNGWHCYNNVFNAATGGAQTGWGISLPDCGTADNVVVSNNIVKGFAGAPTRANDWGGATSITNLKIQNNIFYGNGNSNSPYFAAGVSHPSDTINGNLTTAPPFVSSSDFHLTEERVGIFIAYGLTDKDGNTVGDPPTIGAYQFGDFIPPEPATDLKGAIHGYATVILDTNKGGGWGWIPDSLDFTLQDVCNVVHPAEDTLTSCFQYAIPSYFDPQYEGDHDRLSNFRNYGPKGAGGGLRGWIPDTENKATVTGTLSFTSTGNNTSGQTNGESNVTGSMRVIIAGQTNGTSDVTGTMKVIMSGQTNGEANVTGTLVARYITPVIYGYRYNWFVTSDSRNVCNTGWKIPTKTELETLITYLGGASVAGGKLKQTGTTYWDSPNTGATNEVGFNLRGAGFRTGQGANAGHFEQIRQQTAVWASTEAFSGYGDMFIATYSSAGLNVGFNNSKSGYSLRPLKISTDLTHGQTGIYVGNDGKIYRTICIDTQEYVADDICETKYRNGDDIPEVIPDDEWLALTTGAWCIYGTPVAGSLRGVTTGGATTTATIIQPIQPIAGQTNGVADVDGLLRKIPVSVKGVVHAGAGRDFGPYAGSTMPLYSYSGNQGKTFGFSFIDQAGFYLSKYGGYIRKIGSPNFTITFMLARANANGTPNLRGSTAPVALGSINASALSTSASSYWYCNRLLTAGYRYVIYMVYTSVVLHNDTNKLEIRYVTDQEKDCNIIQAHVGPQGQMGGWSQATTGELGEMNIFLGGVIGTLGMVPLGPISGSTWGIADMYGTVHAIALAPSNLTAAAVTDVRIDLAWTNGGTYDSIKIERSTNGTDFTEIDSISGSSESYQSTSLTTNIHYWYRVRGYVGSTYTDYTNTADDWTAMKLVVTSRSASNTYRSGFRLTAGSLNSIRVTIDGSGLFWPDANSVTEYTISANTTVYTNISVTSGSANIYVFHKNNLKTWGTLTSITSTSSGFNESNVTYSPSLTLNLNQLPDCLEQMAIGNNSGGTLSGVLAGMSSSMIKIYTSANSFSGDAADLPSGLLWWNSGSGGTYTMDVGDLPASFEKYNSVGGPTITGTINSMPSSVNYFTVSSCTISGTFQGMTNTFEKLYCGGGNTISGNISYMPVCTNTFNIGGSNTLSGDIADLPTMSTLIEFTVTGSNTLTGDVVNFPNSLTSLTVSGANTVYGDLADLPSSLTYLSLGGNNTVGGDVANMPTGLTNANFNGLSEITGDIANIPTACTIFYSTYGNNTLYGDIGSLHTGFTHFYVRGSNTISGNIQDIPSSLLQIDVAGSNTITGDLGLIPGAMTSLSLTGSNTINQYTSGKTWSTNVTTFYFLPVTTGLDSTEVDNLIIDLNNSISVTRTVTFTIKGACAARTSASDSAVTALLAKGRTISTN